MYSGKPFDVMSVSRTKAVFPCSNRATWILNWPCIILPSVLHLKKNKLVFSLDMYLRSELNKRLKPKVQRSSHEILTGATPIALPQDPLKSSLKGYKQAFVRQESPLLAHIVTGRQNPILEHDGDSRTAPTLF